VTEKADSLREITSGIVSPRQALSLLADCRATRGFHRFYLLCRAEKTQPALRKRSPTRMAFGEAENQSRKHESTKARKETAETRAGGTSEPLLRPFVLSCFRDGKTPVSQGRKNTTKCCPG